MKCGHFTGVHACRAFWFLLRLYVPPFCSSLSVSVDGCWTAEAAGSANCSLALSLGSNSLLRDPARVNCDGLGCSASLANPPWDTWLRVVVESARDNQTLLFNIESNYSGNRTQMPRTPPTCDFFFALVNFDATRVSTTWCVGRELRKLANATSTRISTETSQSKRSTAVKQTTTFSHLAF